MDDIELLKLENKGLRLQNENLQDELRILRRYRQLIERSTQIAAAMESVPVSVDQMTVYLGATRAGT
jgi:hypothetical protein